MHTVRRGYGTPLLLVHGLGSSTRNWDPVLPALAAKREVVLIDLPGFGQSPPLRGPVTVATLTDALQGFVHAEGLDGVDLVGSSMGARIVLEMVRRGHTGSTVALDPGGFWNDRQAKVFGTSIRASVALVRRIQPALPLLSANPVGRTALLAQFSAHPWRLPADLVLTELRGFDASPSLDQALDSLERGPRQEGVSAGALSAKVVIGWGRQDRVTTPSQARVAIERFPGASLHWFEHCGHFPHWDQPAEAAALILASTG